MPDSAIVSALTSLIPSLPASNKPFPPLLLSQSESLLALSRQRASNLKPEEEIARPHACAEIACTRLRAQLRLPAIKNGAGAPCQPRVYAKLLKFLEGSLTDANVGSLTPRGRKRDGQGNVKESPAGANVKKSNLSASNTGDVDAEDTPSKKRTADRNLGAQFTGIIDSRRKGRSQAAGFDGGDKAPKFVMPAIRSLCKLFGTPSLAPHVYTGACIVLGLSKVWDAEMEMTDALKIDILCLTTALYLMVWTKMQDGHMTVEAYTDVSSRGIESLELGGGAIDQVEEWISKLNEEGWCTEQDWWESIPSNVLTSGAGANTADDPADSEFFSEQQTGQVIPAKKMDVDEEDLDGVLLPGLGTMFHDGLDWTSEDRCLDYQEWRARMMRGLGTPLKAGGRRSKEIAVG